MKILIIELIERFVLINRVENGDRDEIKGHHQSKLLSKRYDTKNGNNIMPPIGLPVTRNRSLG